MQNTRPVEKVWEFTTLKKWSRANLREKSDNNMWKNLKNKGNTWNRPMNSFAYIDRTLSSTNYRSTNCFIDEFLKEVSKIPDCFFILWLSLEVQLKIYTQTTIGFFYRTLCKISISLRKPLYAPQKMITWLSYWNTF